MMRMEKEEEIIDNWEEQEVKRKTERDNVRRDLAEEKTTYPLN